ncbi:MAG: hypothetical protein K9G30_04685 [Parvibaculum sp.]|nr:hypothetical protein [Parvibaculum sp.]
MAAKSDRYGNWKTAGTRRLRVVAGLAIFAMTACADETTSGQTGQASRDTGAHSSEMSVMGEPVITISALAGVPPTDASLFSKLLREETELAPPRPASADARPLKLIGAIGAGESDKGTYIVTVIDIEDAKGTRIHRIINDDLLPGQAASGNALDEAALRRFAGTTAKKIANWYAATQASGNTLAAPQPHAEDMIVTGSIGAEKPVPTQTANAARARLPFDISVGPAPGDGNLSLTRALNDALAHRVETATWVPASRYRVDASVVAASRDDGKTDVSIHWRLTSADGAPLGEIVQHNILDPPSMGGRWGALPEWGAEAASDGVLAVLDGHEARQAARS